MRPLSVAIVGAGKLGQTHARHWAAMPDVTVAAVIDTREDAARALAETVCPGGANRAFTDLPSLLAGLIPNIVDICSPTPTHRQLIEQAAQAGRAVFVEKPLARTLADCDAIVQAVAQAGIALMPGHVVRWFPAFARAKALVDAGAVGTPVTVRTARMAGFPQRGGGNTWYADPEQSGGVVLDALLHDFDWLLWCFGPVARVLARGLTFLPEHTGVRDYALVTLRFANGAVAHVTGSWAHAGPMRTTFEICGDAGMLAFDSEISLTLTGGAGQQSVRESPLLPEDDPYFCELAAFAQAVREGKAPPVTAHDGRDAVRVALAALESMKTGQVVTLA